MTRFLRFDSDSDEEPEKKAPDPPPKITFKLHLAILAVNKQLRREASEVFYGENSMTFRIADEEDRWGPGNHPVLTVYDHEQGKSVDLDGYHNGLKSSFLKFRNLHLHLVLGRKRKRHRTAGVLRYLVAELNQRSRRVMQRNVTILYEDQCLDDAKNCAECGFWPSRCPCPEEAAKRVQARVLPAKLLDTLTYLRNVSHISFDTIQTVKSHEERWHGRKFKETAPTNSLAIQPPIDLMEGVRHGILKVNVYPMYRHLLTYLSRKPGDETVNSIAADLELDGLSDPDAPDISEEELYLDIQEDDTDDLEGRASSCNPASLHRQCPPWLIPEMLLVKRAMLRGDVVAFEELRTVVQERVNLVMRQMQNWWFSDWTSLEDAGVARPHSSRAITHQQDRCFCKRR